MLFRSGAELSQLGCWLPRGPAEAQAPQGHFLGLPGRFSSRELALPAFPTAGLGGRGKGVGRYLPMASTHMTMMAVLNCSMLFWMTMPSMARPV